jgi:DNA-binding NarL/FixJ family response regulator
LTETGKIWKAICIISLSEEKKSGNIKVYNKNDNEIFKYDLESDIWRKIDPIKLSSREKEILQLAIRGYTIKEISESLFVVPDTIKFHRRKLFEKLEVSNITEAIVYCTNNNLI